MSRLKYCVNAIPLVMHYSVMGNYMRSFHLSDLLDAGYCIDAPDVIPAGNCGSGGIGMYLLRAGYVARAES
jgi:hypothetical protein